MNITALAYWAAFLIATAYYTRRGLSSAKRCNLMVFERNNIGHQLPNLVIA
jgi:hypothetical protein